jgi:hypothetical protein
MDNQNMRRIKPRKSVSDLIKPYPGRWIALSEDDTRVVSVRKSFEAAVNDAHRKGEHCPHIVRVPDCHVGAFMIL